jgi:hypothetical protein
MATATEPWSRRLGRFGRLVVAGSLAAAALALPACGGEGAPAPAEPGGNVDPAASSGVGGVVNKAKDTAGEVEARDEAIDGSTAEP